MKEVREYLRALTVFDGELPELVLDAAPDRPEALFVDWLVAAVEAGVREPHALTLSTLGVDGVPSGRVLILKNVDEEGWQFAVHAASPKGQDLIKHPSAALTFYWPSQARQIRVRGPVRPEPPERSAADFRARPLGSRAEALIGRQSTFLADRRDLDVAVRHNLERLEVDPELVAPEWTFYTLHANQVEFWQGDRQRRHTRLRYDRIGSGWSREQLWP